MAGEPRQTTVEALLGNETTFQAGRRFYQPHLCPYLAAGTGLTRPLDGVALEVLKVAQEQLPFVSKNPLAGDRAGRPAAQRDAPAPGHRALRGAGPGGPQRHRRPVPCGQAGPSRQPGDRLSGRPQRHHYR